MAYKITDKPNAEGVSGTYPYGSIKDNTGGGNGVPVNRLVYTDIHQFFARIADLAGVILNSLPDNAVNGWQFVTALQNLINMAVAAEASIRAAADTNLTNTKVAKAGDILSGPLNMNGNTIFNTPTPTNPNELTRKDYVDSADTTLQNNINAEAAIRATNDTTLQNNINGVSGGLSTLIINIGDWNMDLNGNRVLPCPVNFKNIRSVDVVIRDDADASYYNLLTHPFDLSTPSGGWYLDAGGSGTIILQRNTSSPFDNTNFDSTGYNRGWVTIRYIP